MACPSCACRKLKLKCRRECIHWRQKTLIPFLATLIIMCLICFSHLLHFFKMGWNPISLLKVWKIKEKHVCKGDPYQYNRSLHFKNKQKAYILLKVVRHWHRLPRDIVECLSLEIFKTELDVVLGCPGLPALRRVWTGWYPLMPPISASHWHREMRNLHVQKKKKGISTAARWETWSDIAEVQCASGVLIKTAHTCTLKTALKIWGYEDSTVFLPA